MFDLTDENAACYVGNLAVKKVIRSTKCVQCKSMLQFREPVPPSDSGMIKYNFNEDESLLQFEAYVMYKMLESRTELSYFHTLNLDSGKAFISVFKLFRTACIYKINSEATNITKNIVKHILFNSEIREWVIIHENCISHKTLMIALIVTAKLFCIVKRHNQIYKHAKSFSQTRAQLLYQ